MSSRRSDVIQPRDASDTATPSAELLRLARSGDTSALERLFARHLPRLHKWARRRLPAWARELADTADIVQDTLVRTLGNLSTFDPVRADALQVYLRKAVDNRIADECRRSRHQAATLQEEELQSPISDSPFEATVASELRARYASGLARLRPEERQALVARMILGYSYDQVALLLGKGTPDAARMAVSRALLRLAEEMGRATEPAP